MIQLLFNGLVTGLLIALPALALALTFSVLRFANYAIGAMLTVGAYAAFAFNTLAGWPLPLADPRRDGRRRTWSRSVSTNSFTSACAGAKGSRCSSHLSASRSR